MAKREVYDKFQNLCGKTLIALQRYKLKTNLIGCDMNEQQYKQYYSYFDQRPKKRLQLARKKVEEMNRVFEKNQLFLHGLELKTLNNMFKNYRRKMDLMTNQPTDFNYAKFQIQENQLLQAIVYSEIDKSGSIENLLTKIQMANQKSQNALPQKLMQNKPARGRFQKAIRTISRAQIRYSRYYQAFEKSMINMVNQLHAHLQKLNTYYTVWENLGSSMIYQLKSDRELIIDKKIEASDYRNTVYESQQDIRYMLELLPTHSRMRAQYQQKLRGIQQSKEQVERQQGGKGTLAVTNRGKTKCLRQNLLSVQRANWYQGINNSKRPYELTPDLLLNQNEGGFFRYTYEELHAETLQYLQQLKEKEPQPVFKPLLHQQFYNDRFYRFNQNKERIKQQQKPKQLKLERFNVPPHMSFKCWIDRSGPKGYFNILDFPMNLIQRKIQFEMDRQAEMFEFDQKIKKQYNIKQARLGNIQFEQGISFGYKYINIFNETQYLKTDVTSRYDPEYLPKPKNKRQLTITKIQQDFSESQVQESEQNRQKSNKNKNKNNSGQQKIISEQNKSKKQTKTQSYSGNNMKINLTLELQQIVNLSEKITSRKPKGINLQQIDNGETNILLPQWIQTKQRKKDNFQIFVNIFLPKQQNILFTANYTEKQAIECRYIEDFNLHSLSQIINQDELALLYLVNKNKYLRIESKVFKERQTRIKIKIVGASCGTDQDQIRRNQDKMQTQIYKLKETLSFIFKNAGICLFEESVKNMGKINSEAEMFYIIGHILYQKNINNPSSKKTIVAEKEEQIIENIINLGKKKYLQFQQYFERFQKIQNEEKL